MAKKKEGDSSLVYSTDQGRSLATKPKPGKKKDVPNTAAPADNTVRLGWQTKGRKGSGVTLITGLPLDQAALKELAQKLKKKCGCGGAVKNGVIEIQGDHRLQLETELTQLGYRVKRSGG